MARGKQEGIPHFGSGFFAHHILGNNRAGSHRKFDVDLIAQPVAGGNAARWRSRRTTALTLGNF